jgi:uncharacterized oxidoreductase
MTDAVVARAEDLRSFSAALAEAMGAEPAVAAEVARHLVSANLSGHDSHGVLRWPQYTDELDRGELHPGAVVELVREAPVTAVFDAGQGFGHRSTMLATGWTVEHAKANGIAAAAVRHSMHIGRLGEYTERITESGLIGIVTVGVAGPGSGTVAPFGGAARFLGTNPWSMGVPAAGRAPMIFDAATSTVAEGKIRLARAKGAEAPFGTVRDPAGELTRDPAQLYAGGTLTGLGGELAGHKGYGFSLAAALIGGLAMIGDDGPTGAGCMRLPETWGTRLAGVFVAAIDPAAFGDGDEYRGRVAAVLDAAPASPTAPGVAEVLVPGDPERRSRERRSREGIPVPTATWDDLLGLAERFGIAAPRVA